MYDCPLAERSQYNFLTQNAENQQSESKCCTVKKTFTVIGIIMGVAVVFTAGYLTRHFFPNDTINDFLGDSLEQCKNITERQINHNNASSYIS